MSGSRSLLRSSALVSFCSVLVSAISFANQLAIAKVFGAGAQLDSYLVAISVPALLMGAVGGLWSYALVPVLVRTSDSTANAPKIAGDFFRAFASVSVLIALLGIAAAPAVLRLLTIRRPADANWATMVTIARLMWVALALNIMAGYLSALANATYRFITPLVGAAMPYIAMVAFCILAGPTYGVRALAVGMCVGQFFAVVVLLAVLWPKISFRTATFWPQSEVRTFLAYAPLVIVATLSFAVYPTIDAFWAPRLGTGNLSYLGYCQRLLVAIGTIMAVGPATVIQPRLSRAIAESKAASFLVDTGRGLKLILAVSTPAAVIIALDRVAIISLTFQRGAFDSRATSGIADLLPWMLAGMVFMLSVVLLFKALFAKGDLRTAVVLGTAGPLCYFVASGLLSRFFGVLGIAAAYLCTWIMLMVVAVLRLWSMSLRQLINKPRMQWSARLFAALCSCAMAVVVVRNLNETFMPGTSRAMLVLHVLAIGIAGSAAYVGTALFVVKIPELELLGRALLGKFLPLPQQRAVT